MKNLRLYQRIHREAHEAGMAAGQAAAVVPMIVGSPSSLFANDLDPRKPIYHVPDGVCGFAWVHLSDARQPYARFAKDHLRALSGYPRGRDIWVREFGQSMQRKEAYARAYAGVLKQHGIEAYADSRMD